MAWRTKRTYIGGPDRPEPGGPVNASFPTTALRNAFLTPREHRPSLPSGIPLERGVTPVLGWRQWNLVGGLLRPALKGMVVPWPTDKALVARCEIGEAANGPHPHRAPEALCSCGIYAFSNPPDADILSGRPYQTWGEGDNTWIWGVVRGWGRVILAEHGWRAEKALIATLIIPDVQLNWPDEWRESVARYYGVVRLAASIYNVPTMTLTEAEKFIEMEEQIA